MSPERYAEVESRFTAEVQRNRDYLLPIHMGLTEVVSMVGMLQLALRHPANTSTTARIVRQILDDIIERVERDGLTAVAEVMRLGDNPELDEVVRVM